MMRERERCDRGQPDAFGILQQTFIRMAFNMTPTKFPTEQILIASILATIAFLLIYMVYVSIKKKQSRSCERCTRQIRQFSCCVDAACFAAAAYSFFLLYCRTQNRYRLFHIVGKQNIQKRLSKLL